MIRTRREFCTHACHAASLAAAGVLLAGCGGDDGGSNPTAPSGNPQPSPGTALSSVSASVTGQTVSIAVAGTPLANVGGAAMTSTSLGTFLIAHVSQDSYSVLTATCTHEAFTISGYANSQFVCPNHGSRFSTSGAVENGPAVTPLRQYSASFANGTLTFTV
jgi:cytochrome b6-f complex iron-sulfur subunit